MEILIIFIIMMVISSILKSLRGQILGVLIPACPAPAAEKYLFLPNFWFTGGGARRERAVGGAVFSGAGGILAGSRSTG